MKHTVLPSLLTLVAGSALGFSARPAAEQFRGSFSSYTAETSYDMALEVDSSGNPRTKQSLIEVRQVAAVPSFYGDAFAVTTNENGTPTVWYRDEAGTVRNAAAGGGWVTLERRGASDVKVQAGR